MSILFKATSPFIQSTNYLTTQEMHDNFIDLTLEQYGLDKASEKYMVLSKEIEEARSVLLERRHQDARRKGW